MAKETKQRDGKEKANNREDRILSLAAARSDVEVRADLFSRRICRERVKDGWVALERDVRKLQSKRRQKTHRIHL